MFQCIMDQSGKGCSTRTRTKRSETEISINQSINHQTTFKLKTILQLNTSGSSLHNQRANQWISPERLRGEGPTPGVLSPSLSTAHRAHASEAKAGSPPQGLALRSMAEGHLEAGDGRTLALIRLCHDTDAGQSLTCWLPSTGRESTAVRGEFKARPRHRKHCKQDFT